MMQWNERKKDYKNNLMNLHAHIVKFCSTTMREKLEREADWETDLFEDPIKLLKRIKRFMTTSDETDWEQFSLWEAIRKFVNCKQKENKDVGSCQQQFEENARSLQNLMGDKWLNEFMMKTKGYQEIEESGLEILDQDDYVNQGFEIFMASWFIYNCDQKRYQSRIDHMNANYSLTHLCWRY